VFTQRSTPASAGVVFFCTWLDDGTRVAVSVTVFQIREVAMKLEPRRPSIRWHGVTSLQEQKGKLGWIVLWALGVPIPVLLVLFLLRGCT
jgi:hypothetical protein